jgi:hypothetical protein
LVEEMLSFWRCSPLFPPWSKTWLTGVVTTFARVSICFEFTFDFESFTTGASSSERMSRERSKSEIKKTNVTISALVGVVVVVVVVVVDHRYGVSCEVVDYK